MKLLSPGWIASIRRGGKVAAQLLCHRAGGAGAKERVQNGIAGLGRHHQDAEKQ